MPNGKVKNHIDPLDKSSETHFNTEGLVEWHINEIKTQTSYAYDQKNKLEESHKKMMDLYHSKDGKSIALDWVSGLNAPKGLGLFKRKL